MSKGTPSSLALIEKLDQTTVFVFSLQTSMFALFSLSSSLSLLFIHLLFHCCLQFRHQKDSRGPPFCYCKFHYMLILPYWRYWRYPRYYRICDNIVCYRYTVIPISLTLISLLCDNIEILPNPNYKVYKHLERRC